uniref:Uncharacterized protein n=1 Tax=Cannabis sativa TaxID=3483 RepID=A0A803Q9X5_CANSA
MMRCCVEHLRPIQGSDIFRVMKLSTSLGSSKDLKAKRNGDQVLYSFHHGHIFDSHPNPNHLHNAVLRSRSCLVPNDNIHQVRCTAS